MGAVADFRQLAEIGHGTCGATRSALGPGADAGGS